MAAGEGLRTGDLRKGPLLLRGYKVASVSLRENELRVVLKGGMTEGRYELVPKGIIASKDEGVIGRPLGLAVVEDHGSYRILRIVRPNGKGLLRCEYLEGEVLLVRGSAPG
jgi:hypothetical protein